MSAYRITRLADRDLVNIASYTREQWGDEQREKYVREIFALFDAMRQTLTNHLESITFDRD